MIQFLLQAEKLVDNEEFVKGNKMSFKACKATSWTAIITSVILSQVLIGVILVGALFNVELYEM